VNALRAALLLRATAYDELAVLEHAFDVGIERVDADELAVLDAALTGTTDGSISRRPTVADGHDAHRTPTIEQSPAPIVRIADAGQNSSPASKGQVFSPDVAGQKSSPASKGQDFSPPKGVALWKEAVASMLSADQLRQMPTNGGRQRDDLTVTVEERERIRKADAATLALDPTTWGRR